MPQSLERIMASPLRLCRLIAMLVLVMGFAVPATPSFAQAAGHVRAKIVKGVSLSAVALEAVC